MDENRARSARCGLNVLLPALLYIHYPFTDFTVHWYIWKNIAEGHFYLHSKITKGPQWMLLKSVVFE